MLSCPINALYISSQIEMEFTSSRHSCPVATAVIDVLLMSSVLSIGGNLAPEFPCWLMQDSLEYGSLLEADEPIDQEQASLQRSLQEAMEQVLDALPLREANVVRSLYGIGSGASQESGPATYGPMKQSKVRCLELSGCNCEPYKSR